MDETDPLDLPHKHRFGKYLIHPNWSRSQIAETRASHLSPLRMHNGNYLQIPA